MELAPGGEHNKPPGAFFTCDALRCKVVSGCKYGTGYRYLPGKFFGSGGTLQRLVVVSTGSGVYGTDRLNGCLWIDTDSTETLGTPFRDNLSTRVMALQPATEKADSV